MKALKSVLLTVFLLLFVSLAAGQTATSEGAEKPLWGWATVADFEQATGNTLSEFHQAPMLQELVDGGSLQPLTERLPAEPLVDNPFEEVGTYGGSLTLAQVSDTVGYPASNFTTVEYMLTLARDGQTIVPNIAKGWEFSDDGQTFTLFLRPGLKWSDGAPFTSDDILFWWNDVTLNQDITPNVPQAFQPGGEPMGVEKVDDYTVRFTFAAPYTAFLAHLSGVVFNGVQGDIFEAAHYLKPFHQTYNPDVEAEAKAAGYETWVQYFNAKKYSWLRVTPGVPTMGPWMVADRSPQGTVLTRNPYYFKVDTAGNQLPYIDRVVATNFDTSANLAVKMAAGGYDYQDWGTSISDYPAFVDGADRGDYNTWLAPTLWTSFAAYSVNQNYAGDAADGDVLRDVRFREALSLALNRDEINDIIALGQGTPFQATVHPSASFYKDEWGEYMIEHDPDGANALLDEMGMDARDNEGFRLRPDGQPFTLIISNVPDAVPAKISELARDYWQAVGVRTSVKDTERTLMIEQFDSGDFMVSGWAMDATSPLAFQIGANPYMSGWQWAPQWTLWNNSNGEGGEEPPADVKRMFELYRDLPTTPVADQDAAMTEMFDLWGRGLYRIGTVGLVPIPAVTRNGLGNVDENTYTSNSSIGIGTFNRHYQFFWK